MKENPQNIETKADYDPTAVERKQDHIKLAFDSAVCQTQLDKRFIYEPMLSGHAQKDALLPCDFGNQQLNFPIWISSMTGGTEMANHINQNLAKICAEFGLGMGLGSCRQLLFDDERFEDFDVKQIIGNQPLFANLGIAQLEEILQSNDLYLITNMVNKLKADGLIIHVNPLQEWMQPEGDHISNSPLETIAEFLEKTEIPIIVKEVGQGFGKESLKELLKLPILAIEFGANGGTNFSKLELLRADELRKNELAPIANIGHSALQMVEWCNELVEELGNSRVCDQLIISGGIKNFLDGYYLVENSKMPAIYAQASGFLKHALGSYEDLKKFTEIQIEGLLMAKAFLKINR